jgi:hypothetical protein
LEAFVDDPTSTSPPTFTVRVLMGERDRDFLILVARRLVALSFASTICPRSNVLCTLAFKKRDGEAALSLQAFGALAEAYKEMLSVMG